MAVLLKPRPCLYHSLMEFRVLFRVRSNMNKMATASLQTRGSMLTNSRWPPRSQIEKVISVLRIDMVFSIKLTPMDLSGLLLWLPHMERTKCLDVVLVPAAFDVLDHQASLSNLSVPNHAHLDDHATRGLGSLLRGPLAMLLICL